MKRILPLGCAVLLVTVSNSFATRRPAQAQERPHPASTANRAGPSMTRNAITARNWNGASRNWNSSRNWNGGRNWGASHNWNGNWRRHHHNRVVFVSSFGYPFFDYGFGYPFYGYYPYPYSYYYSSGYPYSYGGNYYGNSRRAYDNGSYRGGREGRASVVVEVQRRLARDGFYKGAIDGVMGSRTHYAVRAYERSHGLPADGEIDDQLLGTMGLR